MTERIVALIDMDCFYCQVEARINPNLIGKPMAVVQYNTWKGGGIIAVNYEARNFGVTRHLRGNEAKQKCPEITLVQVPELRGKADLTKYRDAGREVVNVLSQFSDCVERASVDEAYIDLTQTVEKYIKNMEETVKIEQLPNTFVVGFSEDHKNDEDLRQKGLCEWLGEQMHDPSRLKLAVAGVIVEEIRAAVFAQTQFRCSAGIGHNKVLAKLVCCLHKPNRQTLLPHEQVAELFRTLPVKNVRHLGGKLGDSVTEQLGCKVMGDLLKFTESQLQSKFDLKAGSWLYNIARGLDADPVTPRLLSKSIGCCKAFKGTQGLVSEAATAKWMLDLSKELAERLVKDQEDNKRVAKLLTVSFMLGDTSATRSGGFSSMEAERIAADAIELIRRSNGDKWTTPIHYLGVSAGKFTDESRNSIQNFFKSVDKIPSTINESAGSNDVSELSEPKPEKSSGKSANHSFFMKFFKQKSEAKQPEQASNESVSDPHPSTGNESGSSNQEPLAQPVRSRKQIQLADQPVPGSSKDGQPDDASNSNDSVVWTSLGEIFPDINAIDDEVAALLPLSMQKQLVARRKVVDSNEEESKDLEHENKKSLQVSKEVTKVVETPTETTKAESSKKWNGFFSSQLKKRFSKSIYEEDNSSKLIQPSSSKPPAEIVDDDAYHMDESTDVDDSEDVVSETENPLLDADSNPSIESVASSTHPVLRLACPVVPEHALASTSSETDPSTSDSGPSDIPGELCEVCSKHIPLSDFLEHLDFHAAEALHKELNQATSAVTVRSVPNAGGSVKKSPAKGVQVGGKKRGRPSKSSVSNKSDEKRLRSITSFFAPNK